MNAKLTSTHLKMAALVGFGFINIASISAAGWQHPGHYQSSIYVSVQWFYWVAIGLGFLIGSVIMFISFQSDYSQYYLGILLLGLSLILLYFVPLFRGYEIYGSGDLLTHLSHIDHIITTGQVSGLNPYPAVHLLTAVTSVLTALRFESTSLFLPQMYFISFLLSLYILVRHHTTQRNAMLVLPLLFAPIYHKYAVLLAPYLMSVLTTPLVIFAYINVVDRPQHNQAFFIVLAVLFVIMPFYHPLTVVCLILIFGMYELIRHTDQFRTPDSESLASPSLRVGLLILVILEILRISNSRRLVFALFGVRSSGSKAAQYQSILSRVTPSLEALGELIAIRFGAYIFVGVVASVGCLYLLSLWWRRATDMTGLFYPSIFTTFFIFMLVSLLLFFFGPRRIMGYVGMIGIIVIVITLDRLKIVQLIQKRPWSVTIGLSLSIALLLSLSIIAVYPSPEYTQAQNQMVTEQQIEGSEWLFAHNQNRTVNSYAYPLDRLYDYQHIGQSTTSYISGPPPDHYNYLELNTSRTLVISKKSREFYPTVYPEFREFWAFYESDLQRLRSSADRVYANGDNEIYVIATG